MASSFITRCPKCNTSFKVTPKQLQVAKGAVRCGACLHVFKAMDNLVAQSSEAKNNASSDSSKQLQTGSNPPSPVQAVAKGKSKSVKQETATTASVATEALSKNTTQALDPDFDMSQPIENDKLKKQDKELNFSAIDDDEDDWLISDDMDIDEEDAGDDNPLGLETDNLASNDSLEIDERFLSLNEKNEKLPFDEIEDSQPSEGLKTVDQADESWAEALLEDLDDDEESKSEFITRAPVNEQETALDFQEQEEELLTQFEPEPLEIALPPQRSKFKTFLWILFCTLGLGGLAGQYVYFNFDELARQESWRPHLKEGCKYLGCKLPSLITPEKIKTSKLLVRSHPKVKDALIVDALFFNNASYAQPFPIIELAFSNQEDVVTASRNFTPAEYLKGEMTGIEQMPSKTPVHISLVIKDPGDGADNYRLRYLPNLR